MTSPSGRDGPASSVGAALEDDDIGLAGRRAVAVATMATVVSTLPVFLLGALVVLVREDLGFSPGAHGTAVAVYYAAAAIGSVAGGQVVEWIGTGRSIRTAVVASGLVCGAVGAFANGWVSLVGILVVGGVASGVVQPAANAVLARGVSHARLAIAFGTKQAAVPASGVLSGLAVPVIGVTVGWRWAFVAALPAALAVAALVPADRFPRPKGRPPLRSADVRMLPLMGVTAAFGFGASAAITLPAFLADAVTDAGHSASTGGLIVALGSAMGIAVRLLAGWLADRRSGRHMTVVAGMLVVGMCGFIVLAVADSLMALVLGAVLAFGAGWGWPGLLLYSLVRINPVAPGVATGIAQGGATVGAVVGPIVFGWVVTHGSFGAAWLVAAGAAFLAAGLLMSARILVVRDLRHGGPTNTRVPGRPRT